MATSASAGATPAPGADFGMSGLPREVVDSLRRYLKEADRLSQVFCDTQGIHRTDLDALLELRDAARRGEEVGAGKLSEGLNLSTGATTALIDRLERNGHVRRERARSDRRRIIVRFGNAVDGVARAFFRPMGRRSEDLMQGFTEDELRVVLRFLDGMTAIVQTETETLRRELRERREQEAAAAAVTKG